MSLDDNFKFPLFAFVRHIGAAGVEAERFMTWAHTECRYCIVGRRVSNYSNSGTWSYEYLCEGVGPNGVFKGREWFAEAVLVASTPFPLDYHATRRQLEDGFVPAKDKPEGGDAHG
jgi:hypothetical protein